MRWPAATRAARGYYGDESALVETLAARELERLILKRDESSLSLSAPLLRELDIALQRRVLRAAARHIAPDLRDLNADKVETVLLSVVENRQRAVWSWPHGVRVEWTGPQRGNRIRLWRVENAVLSGTSSGEKRPD